MMHRKTWWLTRPVRTPIAHDIAVRVFAGVAGGKRWEGNRKLHLELERKLGEAGIKRKRVSDVGRGSGGRTWASHLRAFGYWYPSEIDGKVILTPVAEALIKGKRVREHITKQIMNYQLPNAYFLSKSFKSVKLSPYFKIFPFRFMLKLLLDREIKSLTLNEVALFTITAKNENDFGKVKNDILSYRLLSQQNGKKLKDRTELISSLQRAYDHRTRRNANLTPQGYLDYVRAISHTFMINLRYLEGIEQIEGAMTISSNKIREVRNFLEFYESNYPFSTLYKISERAFAGHYGLDLGRHKYTIRLGPPVSTLLKKAFLKVENGLKQIRSTKPTIEGGENLVQDLKRISGLKESDIRMVLKTYYPDLTLPTLKLSDQFVENYLAIAEDGSRWREFEDMTCEIFRELGFVVPQRLRTESGEIIDALALDSERMISGLIECKSGAEYTLMPKDRDLMTTTYIPSFLRYASIEGVYHLFFFVYVVGGKFRGERNLRSIIAKSNIFGSAIQARQLLLLLDLCRKKKLALNILEKLFRSGKLLMDTYIVQALGKD